MARLVAAVPCSQLATRQQDSLQAQSTEKKVQDKVEAPGIGIEWQTTTSNYPLKCQIITDFFGHWFLTLVALVTVQAIVNKHVQDPAWGTQLWRFAEETMPN